MKVTKENIASIKYIAEYFNLDIAKNILDSLLIDLDELNQELIKQGEKYRTIFIDYEDKHTEYSPERTEPCPDYYGYFTLRFNKNPYNTIGDIMSLNELDNAICLLSNFIESKLS